MANWAVFGTANFTTLLSVHGFSILQLETDNKLEWAALESWAVANLEKT